MTHPRPPVRLRPLPALRRLLGGVMVLVLALSFAAALSLPTQAMMGPHCPDPPGLAAFALAHGASPAHGTEGGQPVPHGTSGHETHAATPASALPVTAQAPDGDAPSRPSHSRDACCLAACPACLPAVTAGPDLAAPAIARHALAPLKTLLPDGLPPGEALDPPRARGT